jgi:uncharacterized protein YndB with AHSA1/START domain
MMKREIVLPATREEVWAALTDSEQLSAWFEAEVDIDPRPRGEVKARHPDGTIRRGTVIAANAPYRLVVAWERARDGRGFEVEASRMELTLEAVTDGTRLTVIEAALTGDAPETFLLRTAR